MTRAVFAYQGINVLYEKDPGSGTIKYTYDYENRLRWSLQAPPFRRTFTTATGEG